MFSTVEKYGGTEVFEQYFSKSKKLLNASSTVIKKSVNIFEKSYHNVCRSLSLLHGAGLLSKRKYAHIVGQICADFWPKCSLSVKSTKFSEMVDLIVVVNI